MKRFRVLLLLVVALAMVAAACGDSSEETTTSGAAAPPETVVVTSIVEVETPGETVVVETPGETVVRAGTTIKFWSTETQPERLAITQGIIDRFTAATGIAVQLTATAEDQLPELMITNAASGTLPDVVFHPLDFTIGWANNELLNVAAAAEVVNNLDAGTFSEGALALATVGGSPAAVPSDGWGQLLVYRKDLFDAAGLARPETFAAIEAAAAALNDPGNDFYGITAATDGGAVFTQQTYEHFALANGCQLVDDSGTVVTDSANCVESLDFFTTVTAEYGPPGVQDVVSTRALYFAGDAAMIVWSPFILDEMAGLRDSAFPSCDECAADPAFLAKNSDLVPSFAGPSGAPAQYGQISYMGIGNTGDAEKTVAAQAFIEFWLSDGYVDWLSVSPEGKFPMRRGTTDNPTQYVEAWTTLETGIDRRAPLGDFYSAEVLNQLAAGSNNFNRWGFLQGQGELVTAVYTTLPLPQAIRDVLDGSLTVEEAVVEITEAIVAEQELLAGE